MTASPCKAKYAEAVDRESAREMLAAKLEAGAEKARRGEGRRGEGEGGRQDREEVGLVLTRSTQERKAWSPRW